jgi:hypothetical protein
MSISTDDSLSYYADYGMVTNPGDFAGLFENLPDEIPQLRSIIQGLLLHVFWAERYGEKLSEDRIAEAGIRHVEYILAKIQKVQPGPIERSRHLNLRFVGNCRTFSVLLASMLQYQGIPARARCGFGRYFEAGRYEDHWICEYWSEKQARWIMVDAQLDDFQCRELEIAFDSLDVPRDQFIVGGKAWLGCRNGETDPSKFGIFDMRGLWFIRGNLVRDIAALNKVELLPWDGWGLIDRDDESISHEELKILDDVASLTYDEVDFSSVRKAYETNEGLIVPPIIRSYTQSGTLEIELSTESVVE